MTARMAAKYTTTMHVLGERMGDRSRGASALEYVGMILIAALIVGAVWTAVKDQAIGEKVSSAISKILTGSGK